MAQGEPLFSLFLRVLNLVALLLPHAHAFVSQGPQGPKTLSNAGGLRWAKSVRKDPSTVEGEGTNGNANDGKSINA